MANKWIGVGRLTTDPNVHYSTGEKPKAIARYYLAVPRRMPRSETEQDTDFVPCVAFGAQAEFAEKYLHKGTKIIATGKLQSGSYTNKDGLKIYTLEVVLEDQEFAESKSAINGNDSRGVVDGQSEQSNSVTVDDGFMSIPEDVVNGFPWAQ